IEERLRRNAADGHTDAADAVAFDERDSRPLDARVQRRDVATGAAAEDGDVVRRHVLDTNGVRGLLLSLFMVLGLALNAQPALAVTCTKQNANELMERGDVA